MILLISFAMIRGVRSVMDSSILIPAYMLIALITAYADGLQMVKAWLATSLS
ncbi:hypothetical protein [Desulfosporosinus meridiei]|uniref:hypothetical protein n=1 Tax=Desulfosporosinus meridiei TaxID=79209 RepID=UPI00130E4D53|nr:hypothetical protein [Desulfosporosinus meridiei]